MIENGNTSTFERIMNDIFTFVLCHKYKKIN